MGAAGSEQMQKYAEWEDPSTRGTSFKQREAQGNEATSSPKSAENGEETLSVNQQRKTLDGAGLAATNSGDSAGETLTGSSRFPVGSGEGRDEPPGFGIAPDDAREEGFAGGSGPGSGTLEGGDGPSESLGRKGRLGPAETEGLAASGHGGDGGGKSGGHGSVEDLSGNRTGEQAAADGGDRPQITEGEEQKRRNPPKRDASESASDSKEPLNVPRVIAYHAVIHAHAAAGDIRGALKVVGELEKQHPEEPEAVSWRYSLAPLVDACSTSVEQIDQAYYMLEDMHLAGKGVTVSMADCVLAACAQVGDVSRALETFDAYPSLGLSPATSTYNAVLSACVHGGLLHSVQPIVGEMREKGLALDAHTHELLVDAAIIARDGQAVFDAVQRMERAGFVPTPTLMNKVLSRLERCGRLDLMKPLMGHARKAMAKVIASNKMKRWTGQGGMRALTASHVFVRRPIFDFHQERFEKNLPAGRTAKRGGRSARNRQDDYDDGDGWYEQGQDGAQQMGSRF
eukprot:jgi/Botrbrau1/5338/Bobra.0346s0012.1